MPDRSPIALLASASRLLRANATSPRVEGSPGLLSQDDDCARDNCPCNEPLMQPALGLAVADWLEHAGEFLAGVESAHGRVTDQALHNSRHALAVARAVFGLEATDHA